MNKILYFAIFMCFLSCSSGKQKEQPNLEEAIEEAGLNKNAKDSLFLGFNFGMDSCTVLRRVDSLISNGKFFYQDGNLKYSFNIEPISYKPAVGFVYTNDTLSKVSLAFFRDENLTIELIKNSVAANVIKVLSEKGFNSYLENNKFGSNDYYFIKNNTIVSIKAYEHFVIMSYSNAIIDMQNKLKELKEKQEKTEQTLSDI